MPGVGFGEAAAERVNRAIGAIVDMWIDVGVAPAPVHGGPGPEAARAAHPVPLDAGGFTRTVTTSIS